MKIEKIQINIDSQMISGVLSTPTIGTDKIIIMAHGGPGGNKKGPSDIFTLICETLCTHGYACIRFDFRGSGESDGDFIDTTITGESKDLEAIIDFAREQGYTKIGVIGESLGCTVALINSYKLCDVLILRYPAIYLKETSFSEILQEEKLKSIEKTGYHMMSDIKMGKELIHEILNLDIQSNLREIDIPTLFLHGTKDHEVPLDQSERALELISTKKKLEVFEGGNHGLRRPEEQQRVIELTLNRIKEHLE